jgi:thymidylate synthase
MREYLDLLSFVKDHGTQKEDRTGIGTTSYFGCQLRFDLSKGFPIVTTKKTHFKSAVHELLWFISGDTNIKYLNDNGVRIWNEWADENGDLGPVYGKMWRDFPNRNAVISKWNSGDQLATAIRTLQTDPDSRRVVVSAWDPWSVSEQALPPCHYAYQFNVTEGRLSCLCVMRSVDCFLGLPFDIVDYSLLTHMVAQLAGLEVGEVVFQLGDTHIYNNHREQVDLQLTRDPLPLPQIELNPDVKHIDDFKYEDISLIGYNHHPPIRAEVAV